MEVKIKNKDNLIDATIEVVDGVMIVSPKGVKFEPKDGDVVTSGCSYEVTSVFKSQSNEIVYKSYISLYEEELHADGSFTMKKIRPATEEEKQKLFDRLKEEGYKWDANKKKLVKLRWKPKYNEDHWCPSWLYSDGVVPFLAQWSNSKADNIYLNKGWIFRTKEECEEFCKRLNDAINSVKP